MRAILVCVDYSDLLAITLPANRGHFVDFMVVTSPRDHDTIRIAKQHDCQVFETEAFYERGAIFNKFAAMELALDAYGRHGWMAILDADVIWPADVPAFERIIGCLYVPRRRMWMDVTQPPPPEAAWPDCQQMLEAEFAGYSQIFHANDPHLPEPPWHQVDWIHAGGADSFFQACWPAELKIRPQFEVLHLGPPGTNWMGRVSRYTDGRVPDYAETKRNALNSMLKHRGIGPDRFQGEKIRPGS